MNGAAQQHDHQHDHRAGRDPLWDVVVVGGGAAGLAAALQLGRSRRSVLVVDAGEPRNAPAAHLHGYLGHDGLPPSELLRIGREEVRAYGVEVVNGAVDDITGDPGGPFRVVLTDGTIRSARRVLLATGLVDELPDIPGVAEQWGRGVIHCPYCHGWEVRDQPIVVLATGPMAGHQALLFRQLSDRVTVVLHGAEIDAAERRLLLARGIRLRGGPAAEVVLEDGDVRGVRLVDRQVIEAAAVVVAPTFLARATAVQGLGLAPAPALNGVGEVIETDARGETPVVGVYAAGNVHDVSQQLLQAAAEGGRVGAMINADLAHDDAEAAAESVIDDTAEGWDRRYDGADRVWSGEPNGALVAELHGLEPGRALDLGCGEGADAIWLARQGWQVTAVDISAIAVDRGRRAADHAGVVVEWVVADVVEEPPAAGAYDLVSAQYPAFRKDADGRVVHAIVDAVAPGGTLVVVHHDVETMLAEHDQHDWDPTQYVLPADVAAVLGDSWTIEVDEVRTRVRPAGSPGPDVPDVVVRARRT